MRILFLGLAFCSCGYLWLGCMFQTFTCPALCPSPAAIALFKAFAVGCTALCVLGVVKALPASCLAWIAAILFNVLNWKWSARWIFRDDFVRFSLWPALF